MPTDDLPPSLASTAVRGAAVTTLAQVLRLVIQIVSVIVLARLLTPESYGLVAMVLAVVGVAELFRDLGLTPAAIRAESLSEGEQGNLFWLNSLAGLVLTVLVAAAAPLVAAAYGRHELVTITVALAPSFLLSGLSAQFRVNLTRRFAFGRLAAVDLLSAIIALGLGAVLAALGAGYWALVGQQMASGLVALVLFTTLTGWRPGRYRREVSVSPFLRLGASFVVSALLGYVNRNADTIVVGRLYGAVSLGLYNRSVQLVRTPLGQLQAPFSTVVLPVMAAAGDDDERLMSTALRAQVAFSYPILAVVVVVAADAHDVLLLTLGETWLGAAPVMSLVAVAAGFQAVGYAALWIFAARGMGRVMVRFNVVATALTLVCLAVGSPFGVTGVALGLAVAPALGWPLTLWFLRREGIPHVRALGLAGLRAVLVATAGWGAARLLVALAEDFALPVRLALAIGAVLVVSAVAGLAPSVRSDYRKIVVMARLLRRRTADVAQPRPEAIHDHD